MPRKRKPRWPDFETSMKLLERGYIVDASDAIPVYDLEEWEIRGELPPEECERTEKPPRPRKSRAS